MTIFYSAIKGQLILIRPIKPAPQPITPVVATRPAPAPDPLWLVIILAFCVLLRPIANAISDIRASWPLPIWTRNRPKVTVLMFLAGVVAAVVLENIAAGYLDKIMLGV